MDKFGLWAEDLQQANMQTEFPPDRSARVNRQSARGQAAVWQARLIMLVMINMAQLWILAATVDAALARRYSLLVPLIVASGVCFLITVSIIEWWRPTSRKKTSSGYIRPSGHDR